MYNQANIYNDGLIHVNGDWQNEHNGTDLTNEGEILLRADDNDGDFILNDSALVQGNGIYRVENDWVNSATFISDSSHVYLDGDNELITGDSVSVFFNLTLEGTGVKTQTINAEVANQLNLNNLELYTQTYEMFISNSWEDAIIHQSNYLNEGLVSSDAGGLLIRQIDSVYSYHFPVGSKINGHQYRPTFIENLNLSTEQIGVRMIPEDATANGLDRTLKDSAICFINDGYYHEVQPTLNADQNHISIYYDPVLEPSWNILTQWNTPTVTLWNELNSTSNTIPNYAGRTVNNHSDYSNNFYALGYYNEVVPTIYGDTIICDTTLLVNYSTDQFTTYDWLAENSGTTITSSSQESVDIGWYNNNGNQLSLIVTDSYGCLSNPVILQPQVNHLNADFDTLPGLGVGNVIFNNTSQGADYYAWTIGNYTSNNEHEEYAFTQIGEYEIELIASNDLGCTDTITDLFVIPALFWVPNVFTPNSYEGNDLFYIDALGIKEYRLLVFDRWGLLMFESTNSAWDGTNQQNNLPVPEGTYFFIYTAEDYDGGTYEHTGPVMLFR